MSNAKSCPFCGPQEPIARNEHAYMIYDRYPAARGHLLLVTSRHVGSFFETTTDERQALLRLLDDAKVLLDNAFSPHGFNIGINVGGAAGQTILHVHVHVIPRYRADVPNPRGGVRAVIPGKQNY